MTINSRFVGISVGMTSRLICGGEAFEVKMEVLVRLSLFQRTPELLREGYQVKTKVDSATLREFLRAAEGGYVVLNSKNVVHLSDLCKEFGFRALNGKIGEYMQNHADSDTATLETEREEMDDEDSEKEK